MLIANMNISYPLTCLKIDLRNLFEKMIYGYFKSPVFLS